MADIQKWTPDNAGKALAVFVMNGFVADFSVIPREIKLAACQIIPKEWIKTRHLAKNKFGGSIMTPYLPGDKAKKILNFVFNFQISKEITEQSVSERTVQVSDGKGGKKQTQLYEADITVRFTIGTGENKIVRDIIAGHKSYANPATTKTDAKKGAMTRAWALLAEDFGIGSNIKDGEIKAYKRAEKVGEEEVSAARVAPKTHNQGLLATEKQKTKIRELRISIKEKDATHLRDIDKKYNTVLGGTDDEVKEQLEKTTKSGASSLIDDMMNILEAIGNEV